MQAEFIAQTRNGLAVGRFEFDPDEAIRLADMIADIVKGDCLGFGIVKEQAVDDELRSDEKKCSDSSSCRTREFNMGALLSVIAVRPPNGPVHLRNCEAARYTRRTTIMPSSNKSWETT
ncbi:MAG TPA: hypothetical protein VN283_09165 [Thiobacillus sp.]|nr:hypothetical protein [Thiobacillus sp.]